MKRATGQKCPPAPTINWVLIWPLTSHSFPARAMLDRGCAFDEARVRALQQIVVEFAAADSVTYRFAVVGFGFAVAHHAGAKSGDGLKNVGAGVIGGVDFEFVENRKSDPAAADFVARECGLIEDRDVNAERVATARRRKNRPGRRRRSRRCMHPFRFLLGGLLDFFVEVRAGPGNLAAF